MPSDDLPTKNLSLSAQSQKSIKAKRSVKKSSMSYLHSRMSGQSLAFEIEKLFQHVIV